MRFAFTRAQRLLKAEEFQFVFQLPTKRYKPGMLLFGRSSGGDNPRLGIIISKKEIPKSVSRNLFRRLIRESFRYSQHNLNVYDFIVMIKRPCLNQSNQEITQALNELWSYFQKR